jgi:hypothetical protein
VTDVLDRCSRKNGYVAVFDSSAQDSPIVYRSTDDELTQDIIRHYNQAIPMKVATPAARPPTSSPKQSTTPPTAKPEWILNSRLLNNLAPFRPWNQCWNNIWCSRHA